MIRPEVQQAVTFYYRTWSLLFSSTRWAETKLDIRCTIFVNRGRINLQKALKNGNDKYLPRNLELLKVPTTWKSQNAFMTSILLHRSHWGRRKNCSKWSVYRHGICVPHRRFGLQKLGRGASFWPYRSSEWTTNHHFGWQFWRRVKRLKWKSWQLDAPTSNDMTYLAIIMNDMRRRGARE